MTFPVTCGDVVKGEETNEHSPQQPIHGGQTGPVTILMPVADSTIVDHMTTFEEGATTGDLPEIPPGPSAVVAIARGRASIDAVVLEPANAALFAGDAIEETSDDEVAVNFDGTQPHLALVVDNHPPVEALPADLPGDDAAEDTGLVDLGWGIVLPELSVQGFTEILSFPKL